MAVKFLALILGVGSIGFGVVSMSRPGWDRGLGLPLNVSLTLVIVGAIFLSAFVVADAVGRAARPPSTRVVRRHPAE
jgi:hypothetical protein